MRLLRSAGQRLTYANVTATFALFIALGGTSYAALTLPKNSVGSKQIRKGAVRASELRSGAVSSRSIRNRTIRTSDLAISTRQSLRGVPGAPGPAGPSAVALRSVISAGGVRVVGNAVRANHASGSNEYRIDFGREVGSCVFAATLASVQGQQAPAGRITLDASGSEVVVRTYDAAGSAAPIGFHVLGDC